MACGSWAPCSTSWLSSTAGSQTWPRLDIALPRVAQLPTLLVWGDRDPAVDPASAAPLHGILRQSELRIVPTGGHVLFEELPDEANRIMRDWLRREVQTCVLQPPSNLSLHLAELRARRTGCSLKEVVGALDPHQTLLTPARSPIRWSVVCVGRTRRGPR